MSRSSAAAQVGVGLDAWSIRNDLEYPPRSGRTLRIPEVDRAAWVTLERAKVLINPAQLPLVEAALRAAL